MELFLFRPYNFFIFVETFQRTSSEFLLNFRLYSRKSQSHQELAKKITHFTIQFRSKNLTHFTNLSSFEIENNMLPKHSQKTLLVYKFSRKHVSGKCLYISVYLSKKILFQRLSKILSSGMGEWGRQNNFLKAACCLGLVKCFTIFISIEFFWNLTIFQYFDTFINSIKKLKFSRQFGLRR